MGKGNIFSLLQEWIKKEEEEAKKMNSLSINRSMVDQIDENTPPDLTNKILGEIIGLIDQLKRTEINTTKERSKT